METPRIHMQQGRFGYSGPNGEPVFENVNLRVNAGEVLCLLGPNGTGKSTLLKCLGGILKLDDGKVSIGDEPVKDMKPPDIYPNRCLPLFHFRFAIL
jgi:iron complex transport system ATP-binding protein